MASSLPVSVGLVGAAGAGLLGAGGLLDVEGCELGCVEAGVVFGEVSGGVVGGSVDEHGCEGCEASYGGDDEEPLQGDDAVLVPAGCVDSLDAVG